MIGHAYGEDRPMEENGGDVNSRAYNLLLYGIVDSLLKEAMPGQISIK
jgi:hypothetical protein